MSMSNTAAASISSDFSYTLSARIERPISCCEIQPHPFLTIKSSNMDNLAKSKLMDANPHYFTFEWYRGPRIPQCANSGCPRKDSNDPVNWTRLARGGPGINCAICERFRVSQQDSLFCSMR